MMDWLMANWMPLANLLVLVVIAAVLGEIAAHTRQGAQFLLEIRNLLDAADTRAIRELRDPHSN